MLGLAALSWMTQKGDCRILVNGVFGPFPGEDHSQQQFVSPTLCPHLSRCGAKETCVWPFGSRGSLGCGGRSCYHLHPPCELAPSFPLPSSSPKTPCAKVSAMTTTLVMLLDICVCAWLADWLQLQFLCMPTWEENSLHSVRLRVQFYQLFSTEVFMPVGVE